MKRISIVGVPMDLGQTRRGVDMGPSAIRYAGLLPRLEQLGYDVLDEGNIEIEQRNTTVDPLNGIRNLEAVVKANIKLAEKIRKIKEKGNFPLILGGDHSLAIGSLAGIAPFHHHLGVIWYDAHGDLNTAETSPSGNIHGMPLAASLGFGVPELTELGGFSPKIRPENVVLIGIRSLDDGEKRLIQKKNIKVYTMQEVDRLGMPKVMEETIQYFKNRTDGVHLSLDLDALDPMEAPGVGTPVVGGLSYRESHLAMEMLHESGLVTSVDVVEVNPILDERNRTGTLAVELIESLFGKKIL